MESEILVLPFFGQGHLLPSMELCTHLASRNFSVNLLISSNLSPSVPTSLRTHPLIVITEISSSPAPPPPPPPTTPSQPNDPMQSHRSHHAQMAQGIEAVLSARATGRTSRPIACAVIDVMMGWSGEIFQKFSVPTVGFFTSGACSAAMEFALWKADLEGLKPGEARILPGLPEAMALTESDIKRRPHGPPHLRNGGGGGGPPGGSPFPPPPGGAGPKFMGPPRPGQQPPWTDEVAGSVALIFNTSDDLERPFIEYIANWVGKPVWGVGPLLPQQYFKSAGSLLHDGEIRTNRKSSITEDEVIQWLDSKPRGSVLYVSFGSEVGPTMEEYPQLAGALAQSSSPFIWVIQPGSGRPGPPRTFLGGKPDSDEDNEGYFPHGLSEVVGDRGLIIRGWAPQLLILSHPSTGGFLSHCGWNSTVEAIGRGVPFLTWPIRGDQYYNSKLVVAHLRIGYVICDDMSRSVKKDDIVKGIERLMGDEGMRERAAQIRARFESGFPASSVAALDAFGEFIHKRSMQEIP